MLCFDQNLQGALSVVTTVYDDTVPFVVETLMNSKLETLLYLKKKMHDNSDLLHREQTSVGTVVALSTPYRFFSQSLPVPPSSHLQ